MDTKFQTSFIPKKPILMDQKVVKHTGGTSVLMFISVLIFIASVAGAVFSLIWKDVLIKQQGAYRVELKRAEERFDIALIEKLKKVNSKIDLGSQLLKKHLAVSEVFSIINALTIEGVRFNNFEFSSSGIESEGMKITMKGEGKNFSSIAYQSDVFGQSDKFGTNRVLKNPILSDLTLDSKGNVAFSFTAILNPNDISYEKNLTNQ